MRNNEYRNVDERMSHDKENHTDRFGNRTDGSSDPSNPILRHLDRYGTINKDLRAPKLAKPKEKSFEKVRGTHRARLDLHGLTEEEAERTLRHELHRRKEQGIGQLLIIHGYGIHSKPGERPVLKQLVRTMLENEMRDMVAQWGEAAPKDGGEGATLVVLKR
jgi:DNA-nicking Smr family endonuclease